MLSFCIRENASIFGGHFTLSRVNNRVIRLPARYRDDFEEADIDEETGSNTLDEAPMYSDQEGYTDSMSEGSEESVTEEDEEIVEEEVFPTNRTRAETDDEILPDIRSYFKSMRARSGGDKIARAPRTSIWRTIDSVDAETSSRSPRWALDHDIDGIRFNEDFYRYWCGCGSAPRQGWSTGGNRSIAIVIAVRTIQISYVYMKSFPRSCLQRNFAAYVLMLSSPASFLSPL